MIRRPLNSRFNDKVLAGVKFTTIRDTPFPVWKDVQFYNWTGKPYRSKQANVATVTVEGESIIIISNTDGIMGYLPDSVDGIPLHVTEGFDTHEEMDQWFEKLVKPGQRVKKHLMRFKLKGGAK